MKSLIFNLSLLLYYLKENQCWGYTTITNGKFTKCRCYKNNTQSTIKQSFLIAVNIEINQTEIQNLIPN